MNRNLAKYFTKNAMAHWPVWKMAVSGVLTLAIVGSGIAGTATAVSAAFAPAPVETPAPTAQPEPTVQVKWTDIDLTESGIVATGQVGVENVQMELGSTQQAIGIDLYALNSVTNKKVPLTGVDCVISLTCNSLTKIENEKENKYTTEASTEGKTSTYKLDTKTGSALISKLNPGEYTVSVTCSDGKYIMPAEQKITVKEKVSYKKTNTTAKKETSSTAAEDTNANANKESAGSSSFATSTVTGKGYPSTATKTWEYGGKQYLYYADGTTRSAYALETTSVTGTDGSTVSVLSKAVWNADVQKMLDDALKPSASPASSVGAVSTRNVGLSLTNLKAGPARLALMQVEEVTSTPEPSTQPSAEPSPSTQPSTQPSAEPSVVPSASPTETATATPSPTPTPTVTPTPTPTATVTPAPTSNRPANATESSYELFSMSTGSLNAAGSSIFSLPAPVTVITGGSNTSSGRVNGIDVSKFQGSSIDWNAVKASGVEFVIIRCAYRGYESGAIVEDKYFRQNIAGAKAAGLRVGVYFFSQAINEQEGVEEASACLNLVSGYGLNYPIFIDSETSSGGGSGRADKLSKADRTAAVVAFCETIKNSGYSAGVYASKSWFQNQLNYATVSQYCVWNARYPSDMSVGPGISCSMWQFSSKGQVPGISTNVDLNYSYIG